MNAHAPHPSPHTHKSMLIRLFASLLLVSPMIFAVRSTGRRNKVWHRAMDWNQMWSPCRSVRLPTAQNWGFTATKGFHDYCFGDRDVNSADPSDLPAGLNPSVRNKLLKHGFNTRNSLPHRSNIYRWERAQRLCELSDREVREIIDVLYHSDGGNNENSFFRVPDDAFVSSFSQMKVLQRDDYNYAGNLVNLDACVQSCLEHIRKFAPCTEGGSQHKRVPYTVYADVDRGGKTTFLRQVYFQLLDMASYAPIIISNANYFYRLPLESSKDCIVRMLACALANIAKSSEWERVRCTESQVLNQLQRLQDKENTTIVLLIDSLHRLGVPLDKDAALFLKEHFLDKKNRYLVFTTMNFVPDYLDFYNEPGVGARDILVPSPLPRCFDVHTMRKLPYCSAVTELDLYLHNGIPGLLFYLKFISSSCKIRVRQSGVYLPCEYDLQRSILTAFIDQIFDNTRVVRPDNTVPIAYHDAFMKSMRSLNRFSSVINGELEREIPIGFALSILDEFRFIKDSFRGSIYEEWVEHHLQLHAETPETGRAWCSVFMLSLALRTVKAALVRDCAGPFSIFPGSCVYGASMDIEFMDTGFKTLKDAMEWMDDQNFHRTSNSPYVFIGIPLCETFPHVDILLDFCPAQTEVLASTTAFRIGFQLKKGKTYLQNKHYINDTLPDGLTKMFVMDTTGSVVGVETGKKKNWVVVGKPNWEKMMGATFSKLGPLLWDERILRGSTASATARK